MPKSRHDIMTTTWVCGDIETSDQQVLPLYLWYEENHVMCQPVPGSAALFFACPISRFLSVSPYTDKTCMSF
jgi:hypothetical protein